MAFDWRSLLDLAGALLQNSADIDAEARQRTAAGRAYFAAYNHARKYAEAFLDFDARESADDHGRLRAHLKKRRRAGDARRLDTLRQWRNDADYLDELPWPDPVTVATESLATADAVFQSLAPPK
jgi:hypothetical protein